MGVDYHATLCVGFELCPDELKKFFSSIEGDPIPEQYHMEPEYCSKTGKKIRENKVIDKHVEFVYKAPFDECNNNNDYGNVEHDILHRLADLVGGLEFDVEHYVMGEEVWFDYVGVTTIGQSNERFDSSRFYVTEVGYAVEDLAKALPKLQKIEDKFKEFGLNTTAQVKILSSISC